ncbi:HIT domain-containing protein [Paracoccus sp. S-4012]|uniref:histidine triad nucleotide-binding protein n=1 Tax=Paracoccus sp. S-4012 TaxID=2665648 RepID=UPI0012B044BF|nr:histidine triad nucleotide-binding protein [Paracoccus sp. S-4012]MRX50326.1 HIT domain-containing protein [Paracoccus sp. S-4012]
MPESYDDENVFARILRGEIPNDTAAETEHSLAFRDIRPQAPTHVLVIPKGAYRDFTDFAENASEAEIVDFIRTAGRVAREAGVAEEGFRVISNAGTNGVQEVPHLHLHILGGRRLGRMLPER